MLQPLGDFLRQHRFSDEFRDWYLLPMIGCIWSCPTDQMLRFPVATLIRFCHNHGLLQVADRPQWWTVAGGARNYVEKIVGQVHDRRLNTPVRRVLRTAAGTSVVTDTGSESFDHVVMATHPDQALAVLADVNVQEQEVRVTRSWANTTTTIPCLTAPRSKRRRPSRSCKGSAGPGSAARGRAMASMKTD